MRNWGVRRRALLACGAALALLPAATASAAQIDVEIRSDEFNNNGNCSVREAADAANQDSLGAQLEKGCTPGTGADVIDLDAGPAYTLTTMQDLIDPGIDDGDLELTDSDGVTVLGEGRATTIVDGGDNDRVLDVVAGTLTLDSATVRNGAAPLYGGGILAADDVNLVSAGVVENEQQADGGGGGGIALLDEAALTASGDTAIADNQSVGSGGGIYKQDDGDVTLNPGVSVEGNNAVGFGGGVTVGGNSALTIDGASVSNNDLAENANQQAWGSAIWSQTGGPFTITGAQINGNDGVADRAVAALDLFSNVASTITSSIVSGNTVTGQDDPDPAFDVLGPAGIRLNVNAGVTISDSTISQNIVTGMDPDDSTNGAGIYPVAGPLTISGSTIAGNSLAGTGPTLGGGGLYLEPGAPTSIVNSTLTGNNGPAFGGAIRLQGGADLVLVQSTFSGNVSPQGPAIDVSNTVGTMVTLRGSIFDDGTDACQMSAPTVITANSSNVDAGTSCVGATDDGDLENVDADLAALADNGGPTDTMRLLGPAPLFDAAGACKQLDGVADLTVDQRGYPRQGGCEPGAYERFICNGAELIQPGPFPGCTPPSGGGGTPVTPAPSAVDPCPELRRRLAGARKRLRAARKADRPTKKKKAKVRKIRRQLAENNC